MNELDFIGLSDALRARANAEGGEMFMGWPDRWWADPHWRCTGGHVSTMVLAMEFGFGGTDAD